MLQEAELQVFERIADVCELPSLPHLASELIWRLNDPDSEIRDITEPISQDEALAAQMLRIVNSAFYGIRREVTSLEQSVTLLGLRTVRSLVLAAASRGVFRIGTKSPRYDPEAMALHSIASAAVARHLATVSRTVDPELAFSVGLLHDIGKLTLDQVAPDHYTHLFDEARRNGSDLLTAELASEVPAHPRIGAHLADVWRLPQKIASGIGDHHSLHTAESSGLAAVLITADYICRMKGAASPDAFDETRLDRDAWQTLGVPVDSLGRILAAVDERIAHARQAFAM